MKFGVSVDMINRIGLKSYPEFQPVRVFGEIIVKGWIFTVCNYFLLECKYEVDFPW